jgi:hypothetical protein
MGGAIARRLLQRSGEFNTRLSFDRVIPLRRLDGFHELAQFMGWRRRGHPHAGGCRIGDADGAATNIFCAARACKTLQRLFLAAWRGANQLPRSFLVFGQKFVPDSWAFSQTVFDSILWAENGFTNRVMRRVPSALDAAFAVLGNNQVVPNLVARITNTAAGHSTNHAERWRDGLPYQHNLAAARAVMDAQEPAAWDSNIYLGWLAALRELSAPTTDSTYPETMRTRAWSMKTLNTQLASGRHRTTRSSTPNSPMTAIRSASIRRALSNHEWRFGIACVLRCSARRS